MTAGPQPSATAGWTVESVPFDDPIDRHVGCGDIVETHEGGELVCKTHGRVPAAKVAPS